MKKEKNKETISNNKETFSMLLALAFAFNICIFAPIEFYYLNIFDFWFTIKDVLPSLVFSFGLIYLLIFGICMFSKNKVHTIISKIVFSLYIALYIQGNFLNIGYNVLDGKQIDWSSMLLKGIINTLIWIVILVLPFIVKWFKNEKKFRKFAIIVSCVIIVIQIITLTVVICMGNSNSENNSANLDKSFYLDTTNIFNLSEKENIIVFVSDSFEASYMNEILEEYPEYKELLKDFTYFNNTTSASTSTYSAMPTILTGESYSAGKNLNQNIKKCFDDSKLYTTLIEYGYDIELYTDINLIPYEDNNVISNKIDEKMQIDKQEEARLSKLLLECVLYKYSPHFLKSNFVVNSSEFNKVSSESANQYVTDDVAFNKKLIFNGIKTENTKKAYKLYHLYGPHEPYIVNENIEYDLSEEYQGKFNSQKRKNQVIASLKILSNYANELKKAEVYDNTTIILLADHGVENKFHINFLIKNANENKEFSISHAPIAITEDFIPTVLNIATKSKEYGKDIWDYKENEIRKRDVYEYIYTRGDNTYHVLAKKIISTKDHASKIGEYYTSNTENANANTTKIDEYKFGKKINILRNKNMNYVVLDRILQANINNVTKGTNISHKANIKIKRPKTDKDITAYISIGDVFFDNQEIQIYLKDVFLHKEILNKNEKKTISFTIPKELWNENEMLEFELRFPNGKLENSERTGNTSLFLSMRIEEMLFNN